MQTPPTQNSVYVLAGIPASNRGLYRELRFSVGDPVALIIRPVPGGRTLILRDIEMRRARQHARADEVCCPKDFAPSSGLSGDRETATAQATAECLRRHGISQVTVDRTLPMIYAHYLAQAGVQVVCDPEWGIAERRQKNEQEVQSLAKAQEVTEGAIRMACELIASASVDVDGILRCDGQPLTSERVRYAINVFLLERGFQNEFSIVAGGPAGADCHNIGSGILRTEQPVIVDIFPRDGATLYHGDCTRTVVHGAIPPEVQRMHAAVVAAKKAATAACYAGKSGQDVHEATRSVIKAHGYEMGLPSDDAPATYCAMTHGTGHGIGLDVHEPPLLDQGGPTLLPADALTVEPGLYCRAVGGVRVEDMVIVRDKECENLNRLHEGLDWTT
jgi:Xaa-Pro aminopeptidase